MYSPDDDLIDFPVSDLWRDHYAAQGMTYPSGRYPKKAPHIPPPPRGGDSEASEPGWTNVQALIATLNKKQGEVEALKAELDRVKNQKKDSGTSLTDLDGVE